MKKTLITLAALAMASVASAATQTENYTGSNFINGVLTFDGFSLTQESDWTISGQITAGDGAYNQWGTTLIATGNNATADNFYGGAQLYYRVWQGDNDLKIKVDDNTDNGTGLATGFSYSAGDVLTFTMAYTAQNTTLTLTVAGKSYSDTLDATDPAITALSTVIGQGGASDWSIDSLAVTHYVADPVTPDTPGIPEPTTATLSLLALAGLAARRRRK